MKLLVVPVLCLIFFVSLFSYAENVKDGFRDQERQLLREMSVLNRRLLDQEISQRFDLLEEVARRLVIDDDRDVAKTAVALSFYDERYSFKRMGIALPDGRAFTSEGLVFSVADRSYFKKSLMGETVVSQKMTDKIGGEDIIVFSTPVYSDGQVSAALFATYSLEGFREITSIDMFSGQGYSYVVRSNGDCVVDSGHEGSFPEMENILDSMRAADGANAQAADTLEAMMAQGASGQLEYMGSVSNDMYFEPLMANDWYLLSIVPSHVLGGVLQRVVAWTAVLGGVLMAVFSVLVLLVVYVDYQKRKALQRFLYVDPLTGAASYAKFCMEARKCLDRHSGKWAFVAMDLHQFKLVNTLFGPEKGDATLQFVSREWERTLGKDEVFGRRHGDNFEVLMRYETVDELCRRLDGFCYRIVNERPPMHQNEVFLILPVMGIYLVRDFSEDILDLQNNARLACSTIKERNDVYYAFFNNEMKEKQLHDKRLGDDMELAIENNEFMVYYQPKVDPVDSKVVGAEALIRWRRPDGSFVPPSVFIPLAEHNGLISELDRFMFRQVCRQQRQWRGDGYGLVPVSVNLSRVLLYSQSLPEEYARILEENGIPFENIQLEITESEDCENMEFIAGAVQRFHDYGFRILMDDFGTGYSSMVALKALPIDVVKLDKSFIDDYKSEKGRKILISMIKLAQMLDMEITAEGVETEEQVEFMKMTGCHNIQGYYFSRPLPGEEFEKLLMARPCASVIIK